MPPRSLLVALLIVGGVSGGCTSTTIYDFDERLRTIDGDPFHYMTSSSFGVHFLMEPLPLFGDGTMDRALGEFEDSALELRGYNIRIAETETTTYWWILPPITFLFPPVLSKVYGDIEFEASALEDAEGIEVQEPDLRR